MRIFLMILTLVVAAVAAVPAHAQVGGDPEGMAARMNRDYDYPWDPSNQQYVKQPRIQDIRRYNRDMVRYQMGQQAQAKADWLAMTPDQKRAYIRRHPEAFQPGGIYGDY